MARLLVSVRSEDEARAAVEGGAAIIDVKEPSRGSLGMAPPDTWRRVREAVPPSIPVSVALGELMDWADRGRISIPGDCWSGIDYRKIGLAGVGPDWCGRWRDLRRQMEMGLFEGRPLREGEAPAEPRANGSPGGSPSRSDRRPAWVAVVYLDWEAAQAPEPLAVIGEAAATEGCSGVLFDTWDKSRRVEFDPACRRWIGRAKESGRFVALAGSLDEAAIRRLRPLEPDVFAVRGAACRGGDRNAPVDPERVARLVEAAGGRSPTTAIDLARQASPRSNRTPWASGSSRP